MLLDRIKAHSSTDTMTAALVAIIEHRMEEEFSNLFSPPTKWFEALQSHYQRLKLDGEKQRALLNAFLFFFSNPAVTRTMESAVEVLEKVAQRFVGQQETMLHCFHDDGFHKLPLNCIHTISGEFIKPNFGSFLPEEESNKRIYYRFVELLLRLANEKICINHIAQHGLPREEYSHFSMLALRAVDPLALIDPREDSVGPAATIIATVREQYTVFSTRTMPPFLAKLLSVQAWIFTGEHYFSESIKGAIQLVFTQAALLLHAPHSVDQHLHMAILRLEKSEVNDLLAAGLPGALDRQIKRLSPKHHHAALESSVVAQSADFSHSGGMGDLTEEKMFRPLDEALERALESFDVAALSNRIKKLDLSVRDIGSIGDYAAFLWDYCCEKHNVYEKRKEIDTTHAGKGKRLENKAAKQDLLAAVKQQVRNKHAEFRGLALTAILARFTHVEGEYRELPGEIDNQLDHPYSISPDASLRDTIKQARATLVAVEKARGHVLNEEFETSDGVSFKFTEEELNACFSRTRFWLPDVGHLNLAAVSGRADNPMSGGMKQAVRNPETGGAFDRTQFLKKAVTERTILADYPRCFKPFLWILNSALEGLSEQPCVPIKIFKSVSEVFPQVYPEINSQLPVNLQKIFYNTACIALRAATFRAKTAILIQLVEADESTQVHMIALCNFLNAAQEIAVYACMDELPTDQNQLLSALLRVERVTDRLLPNKKIDTTQTQSLCAELSMVTAIGLLGSLLRTAPRGVFNASISRVHNDRHGVQMQEVGVLWKPCARFCDHRREVDHLLTEMARNSSIWKDLIEILYDGKLPNVIKDISQLSAADGSRVGHLILARNQAFVEWAKQHPNPEFRALFDGAQPEAVVPQVQRTISTDSAVSVVDNTEHEWRLCQALLGMGRQRCDISALLVLSQRFVGSTSPVSPVGSAPNSAVSSPLGSPVRASSASKKQGSPVRASSASKNQGSPLRSMSASKSEDNTPRIPSLSSLGGSPHLRRAVHRPPQPLSQILASQPIDPGELLRRLLAADPRSCDQQLAVPRSCSGYLEHEDMGGTNAPQVPVATLGCAPCRSLLYQFDQTLHGKTAENVPPHVTVVDHQAPTDNTQQSSTHAQDKASNATSPNPTPTLHRRTHSNAT